jgi:DNA-binding MarR family transcriptional regulator
MAMNHVGGATPSADYGQLVDAVLGASRALVAVAARSLDGLAEDVTLTQYRVLVELAARGPQRVADLSAVLDVESSTATRMCDRLVRKRLVHRRRGAQDRRAVRVALTSEGRRLVAEVSDRRREEIGAILRRMPSRDRVAVQRALRAFADAAGAVPEQDWSLGWRLHNADVEGQED